MLIATHSGSFHADEVFAIAAMKLLKEPVEVIRTRDREVLAEADVRIDVGFNHDPSSGDFDHHQRDFNMTRENGIGYASFGLIWREYGARICGDAEVADAVEQTLVQPVDANDTGQQISKTLIEGIRPMNVNAVIGGFNSRWDEDLNDEQERARFDAAIELATWLTAPEQQIKAFANAGTFPSQLDAYENPELTDFVNPYFNSAPTGQISINRAEAVTVVPYKSANYFKYQDALQNAVTRVFDGSEDAKTSWKTWVAEAEAFS